MSWAYYPQLVEMQCKNARQWNKARVKGQFRRGGKALHIWHRWTFRLARQLLNHSSFLLSFPWYYRCDPTFFLFFEGSCDPTSSYCPLVCAPQPNILCIFMNSLASYGYSFSYPYLQSLTVIDFLHTSAEAIIICFILVTPWKRNGLCQTSGLLQRKCCGSW